MPNVIQSSKLTCLADVLDPPIKRQARRRRLLGATASLAILTGLVGADLASAQVVEQQAYSYDALGRLTLVTRTGSVNNGVTANYTLDAVGNRSNLTVTAPVGTTPNFSVSDASTTEGGSLSFTVTRNGPTTGTYSITYATANDTAVAPGDYTAKTATVLNFPSGGVTTQTVLVATIDDAAAESTETMLLNLSSPSGGATISRATGIGTILDNDTVATPSFSIDDASVTEGGTLNFTVHRNGPSTGAYSVTYATADGSAAAPGDYTAKSATVLNFASGVTSQIVSVTTIDDSLIEGTETMVVNLSTPSGGATISDNQATGTILDNDAVGPVTINLSSSDHNLRTVANSNGYTGSGTAAYNFVVPGGTTIAGAAGGGLAIDTGSWPTGVTLNLSVAGTVSGGGGNGGTGGVGISTAGTAGSAGGDGISCHAPIAITVSGALQAGGGGGGGGGGSKDVTTHQDLGGGGGGGGAANGSGGLGGGAVGGSGNPGGPGTPGFGGEGGDSSDSFSTGGFGGGPGAAGTAGAAPARNGAGGAGGYAVRKNGITCTASGNITGTVG